MKKLATLIVAGGAVALLVGGVRAGGRPRHLHRQRDAEEQHRGAAPEGRHVREGSVLRQVRRAREDRDAHLEADVLASDRQGRRRPHPRRQARRGRPRHRPAVRAVQERPGRQGDDHRGDDLGDRERQGVRERPHGEERGRRDPRPDRRRRARARRAGRAATARPAASAATSARARSARCGVALCRSRRLSIVCLPRASAISTLARPSFQYIRVGTSVRPFSRTLPYSEAISLRWRSSLRSRIGSWLEMLPCRRWRSRR